MPPSVTEKDAAAEKSVEKLSTQTPPEELAATEDTLTVVDPRELLIRKPMPYVKHTVVRADGKKMLILLQGLSYTEKQKIDARARQRRIDDADAMERNEIDAPRPSVWSPEILVTALCKPDGRRLYKDEDIRGAALQFADQLADGELQAAVDAVLDVSGWGKESAVRAGKSSKRTPTIA